MVISCPSCNIVLGQLGQLEIQSLIKTDRANPCPDIYGLKTNALAPAVPLGIPGRTGRSAWLGPAFPWSFCRGLCWRL